MESFLDSKKTERTKYIYRRGLIEFLNFHLEGFEDIVDQIYDDLEKPRREQKQVAEAIFNNFIKYLKEQNVSNNSILTYISMVRSYPNFRGIQANIKFVA